MNNGHFLITVKKCRTGALFSIL